MLGTNDPSSVNMQNQGALQVAQQLAAKLSQEIGFNVKPIQSQQLEEEEIESRRIIRKTGNNNGGAQQFQKWRAPNKYAKRSGFAVFVGDLTERVTEDDLIHAFERFGAIESCRVIRDRSTNVSKGFGFVNFERDADRQRVIHMNKKIIIDKRTITLRVGQTKIGTGKEPEVMPARRGTTVWVGSLPIGPEVKDLTRLERKFTKLVGFPAEFFNLKEAGYGFLTYDTEEKAEAATKMLNGADCWGSMLRASMAYANTEERELMNKKLVMMNRQIEGGNIFTITDLTLLEKSVRTLWIGRLPSGTTARDVKNTFEVFGEVYSSTIMRDKVTGIEKNCGFVCFKDWRSTHKAWEAHNKNKKMVKIMNCPLAICRANPHKRIQLSAFQHGLIDMDGNPTKLFTNSIYGEELAEGQDEGALPQAEYYQDPNTGQIYQAAQLASVFGYQEPVNVVFPGSQDYIKPVTQHTQLAEKRARDELMNQNLLKQQQRLQQSYAPQMIASPQQAYPSQTGYSQISPRIQQLTPAPFQGVPRPPATPPPLSLLKKAKAKAQVSLFQGVPKPPANPPPASVRKKQQIVYIRQVPSQPQYPTKREGAVHLLPPRMASPMQNQQHTIVQQPTIPQMSSSLPVGKFSTAPQRGRHRYAPYQLDNVTMV